MIEQLISLIAPHECISCHKEGSLICYKCQRALPEPVSSYYAGFSVRAATRYVGFSKELIHRLKFEHTSAAAHTAACIMANRIIISDKTVITYIPTATRRVRMRGYDQAALIAKQLAALKGVPCTSLLARLGQQRQVGQTRNDRKRQMEGAFRRIGTIQPNATILIIDDVLTTGASFGAAIKTLKASGLHDIHAAVFARA